MLLPAAATACCSAALLPRCAVVVASRPTSTEQTHYGVTFSQETTDILTSWLCGTDKLTSYFIRYPSYIRRRHTSYATLHTYADRHTSYAVLHTSTSNFILHLSYTIRVLPYRYCCCCCCDDGSSIVGRRTAVQLYEWMAHGLAAGKVY